MSTHSGELPESRAMRVHVLGLLRRAAGPVSTRWIVEQVLAEFGIPEDLGGYCEYQYWYNRVYPQLRKLIKLREVTSCFSNRDGCTVWTAAGRPLVTITVRPREATPTVDSSPPDALGDNGYRHRACRDCEQVPTQKSPMRRGLCHKCYRANETAGTLSHWPPLPKGANSGYEIGWAHEAKRRRAARLTKSARAV